MQALILTGGKGKRMRPLTDKMPKVMLPVAGKPFLEWQIDYLKNQGIKKIILAVGYKSEKIKSYFGDGRKFGVRIIYSEEKEPLDTGGAVKKAKKLMKSREVLILNGDSFLGLNIQKMLKFHRQEGKPITIAVKKIEDAGRYGKVSIKKNIVIKFEEKNQKAGEGFINCGVYIFQKRVLKNFPSNKKISLERDIFPKLAGKIAAFKIKSYFIDIGTPKDYQKINIDFK